MQPSQLLTCRRVQDAGDVLRSVFNRVQENLLVGGLSRWATSGRLTRMRRITSIRSDVRLNCWLWGLASEALAASGDRRRAETGRSPPSPFPGRTRTSRPRADAD